MYRLVFMIWSALAAMILPACSHTDWFNEPMAVDIEPDTIGMNPMSRYLVVVGDIQEYTQSPDEYMSYFRQSMDWLVVQQSFFNNIDIVVQVGDITNGNFEWQWNNAAMALRPVAEAMPFIAVTCNHDYTWQPGSEDIAYIRDRGSSLLNSYPFNIYRSMQVIGYFENGRCDNMAYRVQLGGRPAHFIALEFGPRPEVIDWAEHIIAAYPATDTYIVTHEWLSARGERLDDHNCYGVRQFGASLSSSPETLWNRLVRPYDNVIAVMCGHNGFVTSLFTPNDAGRMVPQMLFNLQYQENGGNSLLQLWEMPAGSDSVYTYIYNTGTRIHHTDPATMISFSRSRASMPQ